MVLASALPASASAKCAGTEYHGLDYLVGTWVATGPRGIQGKVEAEPIVRGCAIRLHWIGKAYEGFATHSYDASRGRWQKAWTDDTGYVALSFGNIVNGVLTYEGTDYANGKPVDISRQTLRLLKNGTVEFALSLSTDNGKNWHRTPKIIYSRVSRAAFARLNIGEK